MLSRRESFNSSAFGERLGAEFVEQIFGLSQLLSSFFGATITPKPFTVYESGSGEVPPHRRVHYSVD
jgi:hypothetical protein